MRADRWITALGICTRSQGKAFFRQGRVQVNGVTARDGGMECRPETDQLQIDGAAVDGRLTRHVLLCKPAGVLTAARDPKQPTVMDLLPPVYASIGCMPVGRLDKDTTGLLLFTTDGELAHRLLAPKRGVQKIYVAQVDGPLSAGEIAAFAQGVSMDGFAALPAVLEILSAGAETSTAQVTVQEGQFHQIKRMFHCVGREVTALKRIRFGSLTLPEEMQGGMWRELDDASCRLLYADAGLPFPLE